MNLLSREWDLIIRALKMEAARLDSLTVSRSLLLTEAQNQEYRQTIRDINGLIERIQLNARD